MLFERFFRNPIQLAGIGILFDLRIKDLFLEFFEPCTKARKILSCELDTAFSISPVWSCSRSSAWA